MSGRPIGNPTPTASRKRIGCGGRLNLTHIKKGPLPSLPKITLPEKPAPRERWLTKGEAGRFLLAAHRLGYEHVKRAILLGLHTASRPGAILALRWLPSTTGGWPDIESGILYRKAEGERDSKKRRPPQGHRL